MGQIGVVKSQYSVYCLYLLHFCFLPHSFLILFSRMASGGQAARKSSPGCVSATIRCRKWLILGRDIALGL